MLTLGERDLILHKACVASRHYFLVSVFPAACCWEGSQVARYFSKWEGSGFSVVKLPRDPERQEELFQKMTTRKFCVTVREEDY